MTGLNRDYWNDIAGPTWAASQEQMDEVLLAYAETLRDAASLPRASVLVDVGCGCGATTLLARQQSPEAEITGIDVSKPMLEVARRRAASLGGSPIRFVLGDAGTEPLLPNSVDRIISRFGVMFFDNPVPAFAHMRNWLKADGQAVFVVWASREENPWMTEIVSAIAQHIDMPPPNSDAPGPFSLGDSQKRRAVFEGAGFSTLDELVIDVPVHVAGTVDELVGFYGERGPVSQALAEATAPQQQAALRALRTRIEELHQGRGITLPAKAIRVTLSP